MSQKETTEEPFINQKPPNEVWVEVIDPNGNVIEAIAHYGRDGYHPHWQLRDGSLHHPTRFKLWRHMPPASSKLPENSIRTDLPGGYHTYTFPDNDKRNPFNVELMTPEGDNLHVTFEPEAAFDQSFIPKGIEQKITRLRKHIEELETALRTITQQ